MHTVKSFHTVSEAEVEVILKLPCFLHDPTEVGNLISRSSSLLNSACTSGSCEFMLLMPSLKDFEHYFAGMWNKKNCMAVWAFFGIALLLHWNENWSFPVLWPLLSFPNLLAYWVQHFNSIIFRIWNRSTGIPSPPLNLFLTMLLEAHLTSHSRMFSS